MIAHAARSALSLMTSFPFMNIIEPAPNLQRIEKATEHSNDTTKA
jgi:hypothetical protein